MKLFTGSDWGGVVLLIVAGVIAVIFFGYLVYDTLQARRRQKRFEKLKRGGVLR